MQICIAATFHRHYLLTLLKFCILWMDDGSRTTKPCLQKTSEKKNTAKQGSSFESLFGGHFTFINPVGETKIFL